MSKIDELFAAYAQKAHTLPDEELEKREAARRESPGYRHVLGQDRGVNTGPLEGTAAAGFGMLQALQDREDRRSGGERLGDTLVGLGRGAWNTVSGGFGLAADAVTGRLGTVLNAEYGAIPQRDMPRIDPALTNTLSGAVRDQEYEARQRQRVAEAAAVMAERGRRNANFNEVMDDLQADAGEDQRAYVEAGTALETQRNQARRERRQAGGGLGAVAGAAGYLWDQGAVAAHNLRYGTSLDDLGGETAGSLAGMAVTGGPIRGVVSRAASVAVARGASRAAGKAAVDAFDRGVMPLIGGVMEGGATQVQIMGEIASMDAEELEKVSPLYKELIAQDHSPEDARAIVAATAGSVAGLAQGATTAAIMRGLNMGPQLTAPGRVTSVRQTLADVGRESIEEAGSGSLGTLAGNYAQSASGARTVDLLEGVGEGFVEGAVGGVAGSGIMKGAGLSIPMAQLGVNAAFAAPYTAMYAWDRAVNGVRDIREAAAERRKTNANATPAEQVEALASRIQEDLEKPDAPERKVGFWEHHANLQTAVDFVSQPGSATLSEESQRILNWTDEEESTTRPGVMRTKNTIEAMRDLSSALNFKEDLTTEQQEVLSLDLVRLVDSAETFINSVDTSRMKRADSIRVKMLKDVLDGTKRSPAIKEALAQARETLNAAAEGIVQSDAPTADRVASAKAVAHLVGEDFRNLTEEQLTLTLEHANTGDDRTDDMIRRMAQVALDLNRTIAEDNSARDSLGLSTVMDVAMQAQKNQEKGKKGFSAEALAGQILRQMRDGNVDGARATLQQFTMFAESMSNKTAALNASYTDRQGERGNNKDVPFKAWSEKRKEWVDAETPAYVNMWLPDEARSARTVAFAQQAAADAARVARMQNAMAKAFPELGIQPITSTELHPDLRSGPAAQVVKEYRQKNTKTQSKVQKAETTPVAPQEKNDSPNQQEVIEAPVEPKSAVDEKSSENGAEQAEVETPVDTAPSIDEYRNRPLPWESEEEFAVRKALQEARARNAAQAVAEVTGEASPSPADVVRQVAERLMGTLLKGKKTHLVEGTRKDGPLAGFNPRTFKITYNAEAIAEDFEGGLQYIDGGTRANSSAQKKVVFENVDVDDFRNHILAAGLETYAEFILAHEIEHARQIGRGEVYPKDLMDPKAIEMERAANAAGFAAIGYTPKPALPAPTETTAQSVGNVSEVSDDTMSSRFSGLIETNGRNVFVDSFTVRGSARNRIISLGVEAFARVRQAIASPEAMMELVGKSIASRGDVAQAYLSFLDQGRGVMVALQNATDNAMNKKSKSGSLMSKLLSGEDLLSWRRTRILNLMEQKTDANGQPVVRLHPTIMAVSALTALDWVARNARFKTKLDADEIADILGTSSLMVDEQLVEDFNSAMYQETAIRSLADMLAIALDIRPNKDARRGDTDGILLGLAAELLEAMQSTGLITTRDLSYNLSDGTPRTSLQILVNEAKLPIVSQEDGADPVSPIILRPDLLSRIMLDQAPSTLAVVGAPLDTLDGNTLMGQNVPLSREQEAVRMREHQRPNYLNIDTADMVMNADPDTLLTLFGDVVEDEQLYNEQDLVAVKARNQQVLDAQIELKALNEQAKEFAEEAGSVKDVPIHYPYNFTRMGRLQQLGRANPQGNKIMRMAQSATRSVIDLSDLKSKQTNIFYRAVAQGLGEKVHRMTDRGVRRALVAQVKRLRPSIEVIREIQQANGEITMAQAAILRDNLGNGDRIEAAALGALMEYVRFLDTEDRTKFASEIYVEADGITDGPFYALMNLAFGSFTSRWVRNVGRAGMNFVTRDGKALSHGEYLEFLENGPWEVAASEEQADLYGTTGKRAGLRMSEIHRALVEAGVSPEVRRAAAAPLALLRALYGDKAVTYNAETKELTIDRGVTKNPLTVILYGSSANGIANSLTKAINKELRSLASKDLKARRTFKTDVPFAAAFMAQGMPKNAAEARASSLVRAVDTLASNVIVTQSKNYPKGMVFRPKGKDGIPPVVFNDMRRFSLSPKHHIQMQKNLLNLFVNPMVAAINEELDGAMAGSDLIVQTTTFMGAVAKEILALRMENIRAKLKEQGVSLDAGLTREEEVEALAGMSHLMPMFTNGMVNILLGKSGLGTGQDRIATSLSEKLMARTPVPTISRIGVSGAPMLNIGFGDAMLIMLASGKLEGNILNIFDGINLALKEAEANGENINASVWEAVQKGGPIEVMYEAFQRMRQDINLDVLDAKAHQRVREELHLDDDLQLADHMTGLDNRLKDATASLRARKKALARVKFSMDHMGAVNTPWLHDGETDLSLASPEEIAEQLEEYRKEAYAEELANMHRIRTKRETERAAQTAGMSDFLQTFGTRDSEAAAYELDLDQIAAAELELTDLPAGQISLLRNAVRALRGSGYQAFYGSRTALTAKLREMRVPVPKALREGRIVHGTTMPSERIVLIATASMETLAHELVHASTFDKVYQAILEPGRTEAAVVDAVGRIEGLMGEWLSLQDDVMMVRSAETRVAYTAALDTITKLLQEAAVAEGLNNMDQAALFRARAINEFMAWTLANQDLSRLARETKVKNKLLRVIGDALTAIRELIFGGADKGPRVGKDILSNLRFNTEIIMRSVATENRTNRFARSPVPNTQIFQSEDETPASRLENLANILEKRLDDLANARNVNTNGDPDEAAYRAAAEQRDTLDDFVEATKIRDEVEAAGFHFTEAERDLFLTTLLLARADELGSAEAMRGFEAVYRAAVDKLRAADFLATPDAATTDIERAEMMHQVFLGNGKMSRDRKGRTMALPVFIALAATNGRMRKALEKVELAGARVLEGSDFKTADQAMDAMTDFMADGLERLLTGQGRAPTSALKAVDRLLAASRKHDTEIVGRATKVLDDLGALADTGNSKVVQAVTFGLDKTLEAIQSLRAAAQGTPHESAVNKATAVMTILAKTFHVGRHEEVGNGFLQALNTTQGVGVIREFLSEALGVTENNAPILELAKLSRTMVQQTRQYAREKLPVKLAEAFSRELTESEWKSLFQMGKTDIATLYGTLPIDTILDLLHKPEVYAEQLRKAEAALDALYASKAEADRVRAKARETAEYLMTGRMDHTPNILSNATQVAGLFGEAEGAKLANNVEAFAAEQAVDVLMTLYQLGFMSETARNEVAELSQFEREGVLLSLDLLAATRAQVLANKSGPAYVNRIKGYLPAVRQGTLLAVRKSKAKDLAERGFTIVGDYHHSSADPVSAYANEDSVYIFSGVERPGHQQGILNTINATVSGIDARELRALDGTSSGAIRNKRYLQQAIRAFQHQVAQGTPQTGAPLRAQFNEKGEIIAMERTLDPRMVELHTPPKENLAVAIGMWSGRVVEEKMATIFNEVALERLKAMYENERDMRGAEYVDLMQTTDPVWSAAVHQLSPQTRQWIQEKNDGVFMVRKDLIDNVIGYPTPSLLDMWHGTSRMPAPVRATFRKMATKVMGPNAYSYLAKGEKEWTALMSDARVAIVVKSMLVPGLNLVTNLVHLSMVGVPAHRVMSELPRKQAEITAYLKNRSRQEDLEVQRQRALARGDQDGLAAIAAQLTSLRDANRRLKIWPLIAAGHFSSISDGLSRDDLDLTEGRWFERFKKDVDKLPKPMVTAMRYGLATKDTALFKTMARATAYGDFIGRAILYDFLVEKRGMSPEVALRRANRDFIDYDLLAGRTRAGLERYGLTWFWNFKLRAIKAAHGMMLENPLHALMVGFVPTPDILGSVLEDNMISLIMEGRLDNSMGVEEALRGFFLLPAVNAVT